jgi:hypothetical protein
MRVEVANPHGRDQLLNGGLEYVCEAMASPWSIVIDIDESHDYLIIVLDV